MALKRVKYVGRYPEIEFQNGLGEWVTVKRLGHVDLPTSLANSLAEQKDNWQVVEIPKDDPKPEPVKDTKDGG